jgi:hypothetical protein
VFAKGITAGGTSLASAAVGLPISNAISEAFGLDPVEGKKALKQILATGGAGAIGGSFTASASVLSTALRNLGEEGGTTSSTLTTLSKQLRSGSITVTAANNALQQYIQQGKIDPIKYASAVTSARLQTALGPHKGKHVR